MAISVKKQARDPACFDVFTGKFRLGAIRPIEIGSGVISYAWIISAISIEKDSSGTAASVEAAAVAMIERWRRWLDDADLIERDASGAEPGKPSRA